jgi:diacylglycerol kinase (ATP)
VETLRLFLSVSFLENCLNASTFAFSEITVMSPNDVDSTIHKHTGATRLLKATRCSFAGLAFAVKEAAFRLELIVGSLLILGSFFCSITAVEQVLLIGSVLLVWIVEILNSAIEAVVDDISLDHRSLAKQAKDLGSAAVFIALLNGAICWAVILAS